MATAGTTTARAAAPGIRRRDLIMPIAIVGILGLMIIPLPAFLLDLLLAVSITLSVVVLLTAIQVRNSLDFSVFPSLLLISTLFRLALNVSTTRRILLYGDQGIDAAGEIIRTFGQFVVGGSFVVGIVVFLILTLINFIVITRGSGRIAEVAARFTLDALPGKQMSIDSDLASGLITQDFARKRRQELALETDFYGAMDGASKFVRGDAIAGLVITAINIIGGLIIGVLQEGMEIGEAAKTYTVLTIGDGLVAQIPTLLVSTAAGVVVTRAAESSDLGRQLIRQLFRNPKVLYAGATILALLSLVPGMPKLAFWVLAAGLFWAGRRGQVTWFEDEDEDDSAPGGPDRGAGPPATPAEAEEEQLARTLPVEALELQVGYGLVPLVDTKEGGELVGRITALRRNFVRDLGFILPKVFLRDNLELTPGGYRLLVHGVEEAAGDVMPDRLLAMDPGDVRNPVDGVETVEPAFGLPARWIRQSHKARAELAGYTVVDPATVVITHVSEVMQREADKLLGREDLQQLLDVVATRSPRVVDEVVPSVISHAELLAVLRALLRERVSIRNLSRILETLAEAARFGKSVPYLVDQVRQRLGPAIVQKLLGADGRLHAAFFDAQSEDTLRQLMVRNESDVVLTPDLRTAQTLLAQLQRATHTMHERGHQAVVLAAVDLRYALGRFADRFVSGLAVLSQSELPSRVEVVTELTLSVVPTPRPPRQAGPARRAADARSAAPEAR